VCSQHTLTSKKIADVRFAHQRTRRLAAVRQQGIMQGLYPDGKAQVAKEYENRTPTAIPNEIDRPVASMARYTARGIVAAEPADVCAGQMASVIGHAHAVCVRDETVNPRVSNDKISQAMQDALDRYSVAILERLNLLRPIYRATAAYGHFGRPEVIWEASDYVVA
jgi:S-adenosylmethionine synthetase